MKSCQQKAMETLLHGHGYANQLKLIMDHAGSDSSMEREDLAKSVLHCFSDALSILIDTNDHQDDQSNNSSPQDSSPVLESRKKPHHKRGRYVNINWNFQESYIVSDMHIITSLVVAERHQWQRAQTTVDTNPQTRSTTTAFSGGNTDKSRSKNLITKGIYQSIDIRHRWFTLVYLLVLMKKEDDEMMTGVTTSVRTQRTRTAKQRSRSKRSNTTLHCTQPLTSATTRASFTKLMQLSPLTPLIMMDPTWSDLITPAPAFLPPPPLASINIRIRIIPRINTWHLTRRKSGLHLSGCRPRLPTRWRLSSLTLLGHQVTSHDHIHVHLSSYIASLLICFLLQYPSSVTFLFYTMDLCICT